MELLRFSNQNSSYFNTPAKNVYKIPLSKVIRLTTPYITSTFSKQMNNQAHRMKRRSRTGAISLTSSDTHKDHGPVAEHVPNLITLYKDGHVERPATVPHLHPSSSLHPSLTCRDLLIDPTIHLWARLYLPERPNATTTLLVYFHGGGFCVGSASWSVYHCFLSRAASFLSCSILSVNYRLAPEHPLPAAYHDALAAVKWARQHQNRLLIGADKMFLCGDSAGANLAYNTAVALGGGDVDCIKGVVLMQPFFGSERRTWTERNLIQGEDSALSLTASDCYWRMALPRGADRDHEYCNPIVKAVGPMMVCVAEMDILRDGNLEFCEEVRRRGGDVDCVVYDGVGHAFHVLGATAAAEVRTQMLLNDIKAFVVKHS